jgi:hypothetical protein
MVNRILLESFLLAMNAVGEPSALSDRRKLLAGE